MIAPLAIALAVSGLPPPAPDTIWFNSPHLAAVLGHERIGLDAWTEGLDPSPAQGRRLLRELHGRGLTGRKLFADPRLIAGVVLASLPARTVVVPTEEYFYFEMYFDGAWIAGNLRFSDAEDGVLHCGFYLRADTSVAGYAALTSIDDLDVCADASSGHRVATIEDRRTGARVAFDLVNPATLQFVSSLPRRGEERLVSPIIDESGTCFALLYNDATREFYYILAGLPADDRLADAASGTLQLAERSRFAFARDALGRPVLAGVREDEIRVNSFYDGPFDQVPPHLPLRELIREAYPGIEAHAHDALDPHGNWSASRGTRVAISPYLDYREGELDKVWRYAAYREAWRDRACDESPVVGPDQRSAGDAVSRWAGDVRVHAAHWDQSHALWNSTREAPAPASPGR